MKRIDGNTWRTDNGDEVRAQGLRVTVEFGERTKAEVLRAVEAVRAENDKLRELLHEAVQAAHHLDSSDWPIGNRLWFIEEARELGIEIETKPKPCPICGELPKVERFEVNPLFGGGIAWDVWCACGLGEGVEYRDRDAAIECWNAYVGDGWEVDE